MDCSLPGFSVHGILQARTLEWVAISFSKREFSTLQNWMLCFLGGSVVKNSPANGGDTNSILGPGRFCMPQSNWGHVLQLLSLCSKAWKPQLLSPHAATTEACVPYSPWSTTEKATIIRSLHTQVESSHHSLQLEKSPCSNEDTTWPKANKWII